MTKRRKITIGKRHGKRAQMLHELEAAMALVAKATGATPKIVILGQDVALALGATLKQLAMSVRVPISRKKP